MVYASLTKPDTHVITLEQSNSDASYAGNKSSTYKTIADRLASDSAKKRKAAEGLAAPDVKRTSVATNISQPAETLHHCTPTLPTNTRQSIIMDP